MFHYNEPLGKLDHWVCISPPLKKWDGKFSNILDKYVNYTEYPSGYTLFFFSAIFFYWFNYFFYCFVIHFLKFYIECTLIVAKSLKKVSNLNNVKKFKKVFTNYFFNQFVIEYLGFDYFRQIPVQWKDFNNQNIFKIMFKLISNNKICISSLEV